MQGGQEQIKILRSMYNAIIEEISDYEMRLAELESSRNQTHGSQVARLNILIIEKKATMIQIDNQINELAGII